MLIAIVLFLILCIPVPRYYKDGGTVEYCAIIYSVTNRHSSHINDDGEYGYIVGLEIKIFGIEIFDNTRFEKR